MFFIFNDMLQYFDFVKYGYQTLIILIYLFIENLIKFIVLRRHLNKLNNTTLKKRISELENG